MKAPRGQNFLYQPAWLSRVAEAVPPAPALAEIGGGPGGLSELLAARFPRLWVIENDPALAAALRLRFQAREPAPVNARPHVTVLEADVLTVDFATLLPGAPLAVAGNLPYYITSPILLHLFRFAAALSTATLMLQKEVALRLTASPGSRAWGLLSATTHLYARPTRLFDLPPGAFRPAPQVWSTLVRLDFEPQAAALGVDEAGFLRFLRAAFAQKRKQLGPRLGRPGLRTRAEQLGLAELAALYRESPAHHARMEPCE